MLPLFEMMQQALAALVPAFSAGLKRCAANPYDFSALMASAASGNYAKYFEDLGKSFSPQGIADGNDVLARIFGSKEVSRAIAAQAEQMSGIGQEIYKQMLPVMANAMMGGFFKQIAEQFQAAGEAFAQGRPADYFAQWMEAAGLKERPKQSNPFADNPFAQGMQAFMQQASQAGAANPFLKMFETAATQPPHGAGPSAGSSASRGDAGSGGEAMSSLFAGMFDSGIEVQKAYQKNIEAVLDSYLSQTKSRGS
jgi:hypothetical protein